MLRRHMSKPSQPWSPISVPDTWSWLLVSGVPMSWPGDTVHHGDTNTGQWSRCEDSQAVYIDPPRPSPPHNITLGLIKLKIQFPSPPSRQWCYSYRRRPLAPPGHSLCSVWEGKLRHKETYMTFLLNSIFCPNSVAKSNSNYWNY